MDHDRLFKELLTTFFTDFVDLFLPDVGQYMDRASLEFLDKELFTDVTAGERHEADVVVKARFQGQDAFFLVHVENQASAREAFAKRMFRYFARLHEKHDLPVYPVALFSYDTPHRPEPDRYEVRFPGRSVLRFEFAVIQLNRLNWRDLMRVPNPVASALMARMRIAPEDRPWVKLECLRLLATLKLDPARMQLISGFVDAYLSLTREEARVFQAGLDRVEPGEKEGMMEIMTSWKQEGLEEGLTRGRREGRDEGREEGRQVGTLALVLRLLSRQVGPLEPDVEQRVQNLSVEQLEALGEALLSFHGEADLLAWLDDTAR